MLRTPEDLEKGRLVYLYPHTKTAGRNVQRQLAVFVLEQVKHWPMVVVTWKEDGVEKWELVHKDNIRLRRPDARSKADDKEGDRVGSTSKPNRVRLMGRAVPVADSQGELF